MFGLYIFVRWIASESYWIRLVAAVGAAAITVVAIREGWLTPVGHALEVAGHWLYANVGRYLAIGLAWTFLGVAIVTIVFAGLGLTVAVFGQLGRTVFLPVVSAHQAGTGPGKCTDLAAGVGVAASVVLCGAALDVGSSSPQGTPVAAFGQTFAAAWSQNPALRWLPIPTDAYAHLLPSAAKHTLAPAFVGYNPVIDCALLLLTAALGTLSLLLTNSRWARTDAARIALPIMIAVGLAVAAVIPLLVLWAMLRAHDG